MRKIFHRLKSKRFQMLIILVTIICTSAGIFASVAAMLNEAQTASDTLSHEFLSKLVRQVSLNIEDNLKQVESMMIYLELDQDFQDVIDNQADEINYESVRRLERRLLLTQLARNDINGFYVIDANMRFYYCTSAPSIRSGYHLDEEHWFPEIWERSGSLYFGAHIPDRYLLDKTEVVTIVRGLRDLKTNRPRATIIADLRLDLFDNIIKSLDFSDACSLLVLDENNSLIYGKYGTRLNNSREQDIYDKILASGALTNEDGTFAVKDSGQVIIGDIAGSEKTKWKIVCWANTDAITEFPENSRTRLLMIAVGFVIVTAVCLIILISSRFRKLNQLNDGLLAIREGAYDIQINDQPRDEIGQICDSFNKMAVQLDYLINTVERLEHEKQEDRLRVERAKLDALQAQINPHFIYNTLETIAMMAEINNDPDTNRMATALGRLIRISVKGDHIISLSDEIEHVRSYLLIQNIRFAGKFLVEIQIDPEIMQVQVPKLILQPLIENCMYHGLDQVNYQGRIDLIGKRDGEDIVLIVQDNGVGIEPEKLEAIRESIEQSYEQHQKPCTSIGLSNVHQRIRLYYGDVKYGIQIESELGKGTRIEVRLPHVVLGEEGQ